MIRRNHKKWLLFLLAGLFLLSCFFVSPEKITNQTSFSFFLQFPFIRYFPFESFLYLATLLILSSYLMETRILFYLSYPLLRLCKSKRGLHACLVLISFFVSLLFGTGISLYYTLPLCNATLGREENSPFLFIHCFCLQILAAELGSILLPYTALSDFYLFLHFNYSLLEYFRISFLFFLFSILFLLPYVFCFKKEKNQTLSSWTLERLQNSYFTLKKEKILGKGNCFYPFCFFGILFFLSCIKWIPIPLCFALTLIYTIFFRRRVIARLDYDLLSLIVLVFLIRGNLLHLRGFSEFLLPFIQGREASRALILSEIFTRLPVSVFLADLSTKGRQLIIASILSAIHPLALNYSGIITHSMLKNKVHTKVFVLHYIFLHLQMLLLFVFLAFFTGNL